MHQSNKMNTLFSNIELSITMLRNGYSLEISRSFLSCADIQLTKFFIQNVGLNPGKNICCILSEQGLQIPIYSSYNIPNTNYVGRKLQILLYVNHNWNPISIFWKSKTNKDYKLHDSIDCNDIEFWFEGLTPLEYHKQLKPNDTLPFELKDLNYELVITALNMDMTIEMWLKEEQINNATTLIKNIDTLINDYNIKSEKKDREDGVVHNWKRRAEADKLVYDIDTGSAGAPFLKKFLTNLSKLDSFSKVEVL